MTEKELRCSRYIENFIPPDLIKKLEHKIYESVVDAFLDQVEYGKDYVIKTGLVKEDWADGFGTKYTYGLKFDELVRCKDCKYYKPWVVSRPENGGDCVLNKVEVDVWFDGFCAWGTRRGE